MSEARNPCRVLVVDDDPVDAENLRRAISRAERLSVELHHEPTLESGLQSLQHTEVALLLLDLGLGASFGLETLDRALRSGLDVPIVVLTGLDDQSIGQSALARGALDYICKEELSPRLIERSILYALERAERARQAARAKLDLLVAVSREQQRIAGALHDCFSQIQTAAMLKLVRPYESLRRDADPRAADIADAISLSQDASETIKSLVKNLPPPQLEKLGLAPALDQLARGVHREPSPRCLYRGSTEITPYRGPVATQLYFIAQEALHNALRHASATEIEVSLSQHEGQIALRVADNGAGFDRNSLHEHQGWGLRSIYSRAEVIGARLLVESRLAKGTIVQCEIAENKLAC